MVPIHHHPDDAALIGTLYLAPSWIFKGHDSILAVDIGGTNIRGGVVVPNSEEGHRPHQGGGVEIRKVAACGRRADARAGGGRLVGMLKD